jgi:hypothetical protein
MSGLLNANSIADGRISLSESDQRWLESYLREAGAVAGTLHRATSADEDPGAGSGDGPGLRLTAAFRIPPPVQAAVAWVPEGKGMAGEAMRTRQPVATCNLKDDPSATVRPGARAVDAQAAIAIPLAAADGPVRAVVGLAFADGRDLPPETVATLTRLAKAALHPAELPQ